MKKLGFTLIELMIVVAIIAILTAVAAPKFGQQIKKSKDAKAISVVGAWRGANHLNYADKGDYATDFSGLQDKVDNQVINLTYANDSKDAFSGSSVQWVQAGTSSNLNNMISFTITGSALESSIIVDDSNGNDTKGNLWSEY